MKEALPYLKLMTILCVILTFFCIGIFLVGYKDFSLGRIAIVAALMLATALFTFLTIRASK